MYSGEYGSFALHDACGKLVILTWLTISLRAMGCMEKLTREWPRKADTDLRVAGCSPDKNRPPCQEEAVNALPTLRNVWLAF
jgi:hypothetical protein